MEHPNANPVLLIADADARNVKALKAILKAEGVIRVAGDVPSLFRLAASPNAPALILLNDLGPAAGRLTVLPQLQARRADRSVPVILVYETPPGDAAARGFELGAADYVAKPFVPQEVCARVRIQLELQYLRGPLDRRVRKKLGALHREVQARRDTDDAYRALVEHAKVGIVIVRDFVVQFANPAFCRLVGIAEPELVGAHLRRFISEEEFVRNTTRYSDRIRGLNLPRIYRSQVIHSDGSTIDVELNVSVVPYRGSLAALVFVRDIREEKAWQYSI